MDALVGTFHIDWKLVVAQFVNFAIVFFVLYWFALRPLGKLMSERSAKIEKGLDDARKNAELAEQAKKSYDEELMRARHDAQALVKSMQADISKKREELVASAEKEVQQILKEGKGKLLEEKNSMVKQAENEIASLVLLATEKVLSKQINVGLNKEIVAESLRSMKS